MCKYLLPLVFFFTFSSASFAQLPPQDKNYQLVFQDEFDSTFHTIVDVSKWMRNPGYSQQGNVTSYTPPCDSLWDKAYLVKVDTDSTTIRVSNGTCKLLVNKTKYMGQVSNWLPCDTATRRSLKGNRCESPCVPADGHDGICKCLIRDTIPFKYTAGMLYSKKKFRFGYYEIKFRIPPASPSTHGFGPNFWLFGVDTSLKAYYSEIDVFEIGSYYKAKNKYNDYTSNVHFSGKQNTSPPSHIMRNPGFVQAANEWHKAAAWWTPDFIKFYLDDSLYCDYPWQQFNEPPGNLCAMNMLIDINAPSYNFCTNFDSLTQFPYKYEIDYVRVYQLKQK